MLRKKEGSTSYTLSQVLVWLVTGVWTGEGVYPTFILALSSRERTRKRGSTGLARYRLPSGQQRRGRVQ